MAEEQEDFNALKDELSECDTTDTRRQQEITELMVESQDRLAGLMDKMGHCFKSQVYTQGCVVVECVSCPSSPVVC